MIDLEIATCLLLGAAAGILMAMWGPPRAAKLCSVAAGLLLSYLFWLVFLRGK